MANLNPNKLHKCYKDGTSPDGPLTPRLYTLTHSDITGELFLTIAPSYNIPQISGLYTRLMRDEVLAEWKEEAEVTLHVYCHVSGGLVLGSSGFRYSTFTYHMPMVLEAFRYSEQHLVNTHPELAHAPILVHFHYSGQKSVITEEWGVFDDYRIV